MTKNKLFELLSCSFLIGGITFLSIFFDETLIFFHLYYKPLLIMSASLPLMACACFISYLIETRSSKSAARERDNS